MSLQSKPIFWAGLATVAGVGIYAARGFASGSGGSAVGKAALNPKEWVPFTLHSVKHISPNTAIFRFAFDNEADFAGMPIASCLLTRFEKTVVDGDNQKSVSSVIRPYTPITTPEEPGFMDLLIKKYPGGEMSEHIHNMKLGDKLDFKGPIAKIEYVPNKWSHIGMICGGTGITPMWQVIQKALADKNDKTRITLLFGNVSPQDVLMKKELDQYAQKFPDRFRVFYSVDKAQKDWTGFTGYINQDLYTKAGLPKSSDKDVMVFVCGNPPMMKAFSGPKAEDKSQGEIDPKSLLGKQGFTKEQVKKESPNKGREFYACPNRQCNFFSWAEAVDQDASSSSATATAHQNQLKTPTKVKSPWKSKSPSIFGKKPLEKSSSVQLSRSNSLDNNGNDDRLIVKSPYNPQLVQIIKGFVGSRWIPEDQVWSVAPEHYSALKEAILNWDKTVQIQDEFEISPTSVIPFPKKQSGKTILVHLFSSSIDNNIHLKSQYDSDLVSAIKSIDGARWNAEKKIWIIPNQHVDELKNQLEHLTNVQVIDHDDPSMSDLDHHVKLDYANASPLEISDHTDSHMTDLEHHIKQDTRIASLLKTSSPIGKPLNSESSSIEKTKVILAIEDSKLVVLISPSLPWLSTTLKQIIGNQWIPERNIWKFPLGALTAIRAIIHSMKDSVILDDIPKWIEYLAIENIPPLEEQVSTELPTKLSTRLFMQGKLHNMLPFQKQIINEMVQKKACLIQIKCEKNVQIRTFLYGILASDVPSAIITCSEYTELLWENLSRQLLSARYEIKMWEGNEYPVLERNSVLIMNYRKMNECDMSIYDIPPMVIVDDAMVMKSINSRITRGLTNLCGLCPKRVLVVGDILWDRPVEMFSLLRLVSPYFSSQIEFCKRYCSSPFDTQFSGSSCVRNNELEFALKRTCLLEISSNSYLSHRNINS